MTRSIFLWFLKNRFVKFGMVGFSGTFVNLAVLYIAQEVLFGFVESRDTRLSLSLALAIFCATVSNFSLNRIWTWADRKNEIARHYFFHLGQYFLACWLAIAIQFVLTKLLAIYFHDLASHWRALPDFSYLAANVLAIVVSSIVNFLVNDIWTFGIKKASPPAECIERDA